MTVTCGIQHIGVVTMEIEVCHTAVVTCALVICLKSEGCRQIPHAPVTTTY